MTEDELLLLDRLGPLLLDVSRLDEELRAMMMPGAPKGGEGSRGKPGSRPPVSTHLLDLTVEAWEITRNWAANLAEDFITPPEGIDPRGWMERRHRAAKGYCDWLYTYRELIPSRDWCDDLIRELDDIAGRMADVLPKAEPEPIRTVPDTARDMLVTAREASKITGIKEGTIRRWGSTGTIPSTGTPRRYQIGDILDHHNRPTEST